VRAGGVVTGKGIGEDGKHRAEHDAGEVASDLLLPPPALLQRDGVEGAALFGGDEGNAAENEQEQPQCMVGGEIARIEQIGSAARKTEDLAEIDFKEILCWRQGALPVESPEPAIGEDAPAERAACDVFGAPKICRICDDGMPSSPWSLSRPSTGRSSGLAQRLDSRMHRPCWKRCHCALPCARCICSESANSSASGTSLRPVAD
jgi:hypothetical protein